MINQPRNVNHGYVSSSLPYTIHPQLLVPCQLLSKVGGHLTQQLIIALCPDEKYHHELNIPGQYPANCSDPLAWRLIPTYFPDGKSNA